MHHKAIGDVNCCVFSGERVIGQEADTILVPVTPHHPPTGGVFEGVRQAGAIKGCETLINWHEISPDHMRPGETMRVTAGGGKTKYLHHTATVPELGEGRKSQFAIVVIGVQSVLEDMQKHGLTSVNMPLIGTGELGWLTPEQSAQAMLAGIARFNKRHPGAKMGINVCIPSPEWAQQFIQTLEHPERYENLDDQTILETQGKASPPGLLIDTSRTQDPLAQRLPGAPPKFAGTAKWAGGRG